MYKIDIFIFVTVKDVIGFTVGEATASESFKDGTKTKRTLPIFDFSLPVGETVSILFYTCKFFFDLNLHVIIEMQVGVNFWNDQIGLLNDPNIDLDKFYYKIIILDGSISEFSQKNNININQNTIVKVNFLLIFCGSSKTNVHLL